MVITILTSFSTTAFILIGIILLIKIASRKSVNKYLRAAVFSVSAVIVVYALGEIIYEKMTNSSFSYNSHLSDYTTTLLCFLNNPIFGVGFDNVSGLNSYRDFAGGLSTGLGGILAYGGIVWGIWFIAPFVYSVIGFIKSKSNRYMLGFCIVYTILLVAVIVQDTALSSMINAICWKYIINTSNKSLAK